MKFITFALLICAIAVATVLAHPGGDRRGPGSGDRPGSQAPVVVVTTPGKKPGPTVVVVQSNKPGPNSRPDQNRRPGNGPSPAVVVVKDGGKGGHRH